MISVDAYHVGQARDCASRGLHLRAAHPDWWPIPCPDAAPHLQDGHHYSRQQGITVIDGGSPLMFEPVADPGQKALRVLFTLTAKVPEHV